MAGRPKSAVFNNFGPKKRMHQKKSQSLLSTAASNPRFSHPGGRHQSGVSSSIRPHPDVLERVRMNDVMDSIQGLGFFDKNKKNSGSSYPLTGKNALSGNQFSIQ